MADVEPVGATIAGDMDITVQWPVGPSTHLKAPDLFAEKLRNLIREYYGLVLSPGEYEDFSDGGPGTDQRG